MSVKFVKVTELRNRRQSCQKTTVTGLENMLPCQSLITENDSMELLSQVRSYMSYMLLKPLPKLGPAAEDFDSWALTAGILLNKVIFFSNKRTRL